MIVPSQRVAVLIEDAVCSALIISLEKSVPICFVLFALSVRKTFGHLFNWEHG